MGTFLCPDFRQFEFQTFGTSHLDAYFTQKKVSEIGTILLSEIGTVWEWDRFLERRNLNVPISDVYFTLDYFTELVMKGSTGQFL